MSCSGAVAGAASGVGTLDPLAGCFLLAGDFLLAGEGSVGAGVASLDPLASCFLLAGYFFLPGEGVGAFAGSGVVAVDPLVGCFLLVGEGVGVSVCSGVAVGLVPCSFAFPCA